MTDDALVWLTYDELAERLSIARESARTLVKRKRWARRPGNDGKSRIGVPAEALLTRDTAKAVPGDVPGNDPGDEPESVPASDPGHVGVVVETLNRHVERLEAQLDAALIRAADRDTLAGERDVLTVQLDALRAALAAAEGDRDRWHAMATREPERRPWWRRLAG